MLRERSITIPLLMEANTLLRLGTLAALCPSSRRSMQQKSFRANMDGKPKQSFAATTVKLKKEMERTVYQDNWFDHLAITHLSRSIQSTNGMSNNKEGYESLVEAAMMVSKNFNGNEQQDVVIQSLKKAFPSHLLIMIKFLLPPSRFERELFAAFTTVFFSWLVGPCEVRTSEAGQGKTEHNVVYIPRCRFLESTRCIGMCTNLCKIPCQSFIQDSLGIPVNMVPNFEDMSCEMIFGEKPPADDPALKQPCYLKLCIAKQEKGVNCSS